MISFLFGWSLFLGRLFGLFFLWLTLDINRASPNAGALKRIRITQCIVGRVKRSLR